MSLSSPAGATTQAMGEYSGPPFIGELARNLSTLVLDNVWYLVGGLAAIIVVWLYVRR